MDILYDRQIDCPAPLSQTDVAGILQGLGIPTRDKTIKEVQLSFDAYYEQALARSPRGRPANEEQYRRNSNYYGNIKTLQQCQNMLQKLKIWMLLGHMEQFGEVTVIKGG